MMDGNGVWRDRRPDALGDLRALPDEIISDILSYLSPRDVARLACVSSVMYVFCNDDPLWMTLCLKNASRLIEYKGSWKRTYLQQENIQNGEEDYSSRVLHFDGFNSLFLYKRMYRCYTRLGGFYRDNSDVERKSNLSLEEFQHQYDGKKPVLLTGLADTWPARETWTTSELSNKYGDTTFKISQRSSRKLTMTFKDYVSYMENQHDEDPLYIFDDKFGEAAPDLLRDYDVPHLFHEDFFDVLERDQRPPFRWLIIGPERSGASWHVDPALTSAWNTLLCGQKRWAMYPPGRVPGGVTVHVNEEDGDVNIETPTSLQWWLEYYPLLSEEEKPIECTQLPGETIFVPSGWWHCVLNLETTIAVTQNFVNSKNFEFVCLDMAPGYRHKGVCRAGFIALDEKSLEDLDNKILCNEVGLAPMESSKKGKRLRMCQSENSNHNNVAECCQHCDYELPYEINILSTFLDEDRDHYNSLWSSGNCIGQREMRGWLWKLWIAKPEMRDLTWKGACLALNARRWLDCILEICKFHQLPSPTEGERLPVGTGSNPVYLIGDNVIKIYVEGGLESSLHGLGTELEFYSVLSKAKSGLKDHIPDILASGILFDDNGSNKIVPWDGKDVPNVVSNYIPMTKSDSGYGSSYGLWRKLLFDYKKAKISGCESNISSVTTAAWPYVITKRCHGKIFGEVRESLSLEDTQNLASFVGEQLHNLHILPIPSLDNSALPHVYQTLDSSSSAITLGVDGDSKFAVEWKIFVRTLEIRKQDLVSRLKKWGDPIPASLIDKANEYLPDNFEQLLHIYKDKRCSWIHSDIMDDNVHMEPVTDSTADSNHQHAGSINGNSRSGENVSWKPSHILDFSDLTIGDSVLDLIPIHLDIFRGDSDLLKRLLASYKLPLWKKPPESVNDNTTWSLSYLTMCYCILHEENVLGAIFGIWDELRTANSWEEVEDKVWGDLNNYGFS